MRWMNTPARMGVTAVARAERLRLAVDLPEPPDLPVPGRTGEHPALPVSPL